MSNDRSRYRGNLFEYAQKQKPSQPDFHGDSVIDGTPYEIRGWHREGRLAISFAPPRGDKNTFPPDAFRGALDPAPPKPAPPKGRNAKAAAADEPAVPAWSGTIVGDEAAYLVRAFEKQGKSGPYFTLSFEQVAKPPKAETTWDETPDTGE